MSFLSQAYLLEKYGPRLSMQDLAEHHASLHRIGRRNACPACSL